ncbi:hypothetical protein K3G63_13760 [Hymenobacter sp. HSC-4F20]|uniref:hypothetical protein n=1 Tax=Hymenobacter sp. HSC-4F20 TaxID=2864135 RepID=UPI001C736895|nr:hypothetical protein [Hymenobacter sp. HSC-4F20]MBX0291511.1 hypothetical protein [Hymenobacter sp. HSC-4F20]
MPKPTRWPASGDVKEVVKKLVGKSVRLLCLAPDHDRSTPQISPSTSLEKMIMINLKNDYHHLFPAVLIWSPTMGLAKLYFR